MSRWRSERGAAAVEFALVLPMLLAILLGIIEFGRAYNAQVSLTHSAREAARSFAIGEKRTVEGVTLSRWESAVKTGRDAAPSLVGDVMDFGDALADCPSKTTVQIKIEYPLQTVTGIADGMTLQGTAAMRCGG